MATRRGKMRRLAVGLVVGLLGSAGIADAYCPPKALSLVQRVPRGGHFHHYIRGCERTHGGSGHAGTESASKSKENGKGRAVATDKAGRGAAGSR